MAARRALAPAVVALLLVLAVGCEPPAEEEPEPVALEATPVPEETPTPTPTPTPSPTPTPTPTPEEEREPTDADVARFADGYDPDGASVHREVAVDLTDDGVREIVFVLIVDVEQRSRVDVAAWRGTRYEIVDRGLGGRADRVEELWVRDVTDDARREVVVFQTAGATARSASLWQATAEARLAPLTGRGDCFDGSHTYGDTDVEVFAATADRPAEVHAVCEEADRPRELWPTVVYVWEEEAFRCDHRRTGDDDVRTDCQ